MNRLTNESAVPVVLTEGFRFFFLFASLFAIFSISAWLSELYSQGGFFSYLTPIVAMDGAVWHAHEMIYGYAVAVVAGFFLTAVPNWTKTQPARAAYIMSVGGLWLLGRIAMWYSGTLPVGLVAFADLIFLPPLLVRLVMQMRNNPQLHNLIFISLLGVLWIANLLCHLEWLGLSEETAQTGLRLGLFTVGMMVFVIGGRVVPAFTRNAMRRMGYEEEQLPDTDPRANKLALVTTGLFTLSFFFSLPEMVTGCLALAAALANAWRFSGWRWQATLKVPILWSLHLGYSMLILAYAFYGLAQVTGLASESSALHLLAISAIGCMTVAVMSRASLGHTGRPLEVRPMVALAYILVVLSGLVRAFLPDLVPATYDHWIWISGGFWVVGFVLFIGVYFPVLTTPRLRG
ncbi:MAG: NnrS family protein [Cohaesibacter sp.]|jgi:uncharacterized protein involved in response to NO|nr:NnrS family protein [Cohaesibacter sp.]